jgi:RNA polymerase sigma-70 factor (ECF subfamily)
VLTRIAGLSYTEAAEVIDCPTGTVRSLVERARDDLIAGMRDGASTGGAAGSSRRRPGARSRTAKRC